ncbi:Ig-like domain-containing protein [Saccharicrinis sp. FJH2]|uniref:Ig-like domain-containing protein n=1 Tax=Saccharicrinis sp. FJH65 TaxID=3344659 RepID=UPI0035F317F7
MRLVKLIIAIILIALPLNAVNAAVIGVTSPKKNSVYTAGSTLYISYVFLDVDTVNIEVFSPLNGGTWEVVVDSLPTVEGSKIPIQNLKAPDWAHYEIRIIDLHHKADTAYSGPFTILNPPSPVLRLKIQEDTIQSGSDLNLNWDISPSIDSIAFEQYDPWKKRWIKQDFDYLTRDSSKMIKTGKGLMGGLHYFRIYDVNYPDKYSNTDSFYVRDNVFGGIDSLFPANDAENVDIRLESESDTCVFLIYFKEFIELVPGKNIEINNEAQGVVTTISTSDTAKVKVINDINGDPTILCIKPPLPLTHSTRYYILSDKGIVKDMLGNIFNGFRSNLDWNFHTETLNDFKGTLTYNGALKGNLVIGLYDQSDIESNITNHPENFEYNEDTEFPYSYAIGAPVDGTYGIFCFLDLNNNFEADAGEPTGFLDSLSMNGKDTTGINILLTDNASVDDVFVFDQAKSYWGNNETFGYNAFLKSYYAGDWYSGSTPVISNAYKIEELLWGVSFKIRENGSDDLANSVLKPGTVAHLEFGFPDSLTINYIAAGGIITKAQMLSNRLVLDLTVVNPVSSNSGNLKASLGFIISCSPDHSAGVNAYGSLFFGDNYIKDISPVLSGNGNAIGVRINGKNGVESHLIGMLSDNFLINNFSQIDPKHLPANSNSLMAVIPELDPAQYEVDNSFDVYSKSYDVDGDGKLNKMYRVVVSNNSWSAHDILFTYDVTTDIKNPDAQLPDIYYNGRLNALIANKVIPWLTVYDITGKVVFISHTKGSEFKLPDAPTKGVYFVKTQNKQVRKVLIQ